MNLNKTIVKLRKSSRQQSRAIADVKAQLELHQVRYEQLELEMSETQVALAQDNPKNIKKIADLEAEKLELITQVQNLEVQKMNYEALKAENEMELLYRQSAEANYQRISNIMNNTQVQFRNISINFR